MTSEPIPLPALNDNYIWTMDARGQGAVIVDPGAAAPVLDAVARGLKPKAILLTHHHHDHVGGVAELQAALSLPVHAPHDERIELECERLGEGDEVVVAGMRFRVLEVPGHTLSHIAFVGEGVVFAGDTLFSLGCGRIFEGTPAQMHASVQRLGDLPADTLLCCAHEYTLANGAFAQAVEPENVALDAHLARVREMRAAGRPSLPVRIGEERRSNPFLRCHEASVRQAVEQHVGRTLTDPVEVFAALRAWKDGFVPS